jgi:septum formation protein
MERDERQIVLASGSPRRRELLTMLGFVPEIRVSAVPEFPTPDETPEAYTRRLSGEKALSVSQTVEDSRWILAADTVVVLNGKILEKPNDEEHAVDILKELAGGWHAVVTSFCWAQNKDVRHVETVEAKVKLRDMSDAFIRNYVATGEPMDKAGGYGIQGIGSAMVERIDGSYHCVVGLPICEVVRALQGLGGVTEFPFVERS